MTKGKLRMMLFAEQMDRGEIRAVLWSWIGALLVIIALLTFALTNCRYSWPAELNPLFTMRQGCTVEVDGKRISVSEYQIKEESGHE